MTLRFSVSATDGAARKGRLVTAHGAIDTPTFMPVGTAATVKAMTPEAVAATGAQIILGNTYHLMLRPTAERVAKLGGLHKFMNWPGPILTDSGGFQVMSLSQLNKVTEQGVAFQSHIDGARYELTPERSIEIQHLLDATITMQLDECVKLPADDRRVSEAMQLSLRWAERCKAAFRERDGYGLFGIVQGGTNASLREQSAKGLISTGFDGYAVGGLAVGETQAEMFGTLDVTVPHLPHDRPRYLMGVGKPSDLVGAVQRGIDMFDCVMPTRSGRNGQAFTRRGTLNIRNARHAEDPRPLDEHCRCPACHSYSRAYLHHLVRADEILGSMLMTAHNLTYYQDLMTGMRDAIAGQRLDAFVADFHAGESRGDIDPL